MAGLPNKSVLKAKMTQDRSECNMWFAGDDFCDDECNTEEWEWDGGDCCGPSAEFIFCFDCMCLDPSSDDFGSVGDNGGWMESWGWWRNDSPNGRKQ